MDGRKSRSVGASNGSGYYGWRRSYVNPAIHAAILAASKQEAIEEKIETRLRSAKALGPSSSIAFTPADEAEQRLLEAALITGNVVRTVDGRIYLNERAIADGKEGQGYMALLITLIIGSLIASVAALAISGVL
jgi:hypothetical protein